MSDTPREMSTPRPHPVVLRFQRFKGEQAPLFEGLAHGLYLENRLNVAFNAGWKACLQAIREATGE